MKAAKLRAALLVDLTDYGAATTIQLADRFEEGKSRIYSLLRTMEIRGLVERAGLAPSTKEAPAPGMLWRRAERSPEPASRCRAILETMHRGRPHVFRCGYSRGHDGTGAHCFAFHVEPGRRASWKDTDPGASYLGREHDPNDREQHGRTTGSGEQGAQG